MYMAENKENPKYYFIIGKFSTPSKIDRNMIVKIQMLDCMNYGQCFNQYIADKKIIDKYPK